MNNKNLSVSRRVRATPYSKRVEQAGVQSYTVYNHMLLPTQFKSPEEDYWHLCEHVQVWDVAVERQVELKGLDAAKLAQLMTPRDLRSIDILQGKYAPICDEQGFIVNDPIVIKLADDRFWLSLADSDVTLFAKGLAIGYGLDVDVFEPDVFPLAVQGPKADELMTRVFGEQTQSIRFFRGEMLNFNGVEMYVARSGWSKQGGFEIYVPNPDIAVPLWDALFEKGHDLNVRAGCPNCNERLEAGLLSYGGDMDAFDTPFECGLDGYLDLSADIESLSIQALREKQHISTRRLVGLAFEGAPNLTDVFNYVGGADLFVDGKKVGELRSQAWSFKYEKQLAFAMIDTDYLDNNERIEVDGMSSIFHEIPFDPDKLKA